MQRALLMVSAVVLGAGLLVSCGDEETIDRDEAKTLARDFFSAAMVGDIEKLIGLVDFPFKFDELECASEASLRRALEKHGDSLRQQVKAARKVELVTYAELLSGTPIAGKSLTEEQAVTEAKKIDLREGGILVRCYHVNPDTDREDGRQFYLVMHEDALGDLKVTTYHH